MLPRQMKRMRTGSVWRTRGSLTRVTDEPNDLLGTAALDAAVAALSDRNRHHLDGMSEEERGQALHHWRELAIAVLTAATAATGVESSAVEPEAGPGRAVLVFEDDGDEIALHASFYPVLEDLGDGEVAATPAQVAALELLQEMTEEDE
jgi:hypothetical protein